MTFTNPIVRLSPLHDGGAGHKKAKGGKDHRRTTRTTTPSNPNTQPSELARCITAEGIRPARPDGLCVQRSQLRAVNCQILPGNHVFLDAADFAGVAT